LLSWITCKETKAIRVQQGNGFDFPLTETVQRNAHLGNISNDQTLGQRGTHRTSR
jgi:hypothetical protein